MRIFDVDQIPPSERSGVPAVLLSDETVEEAFRAAGGTTILFTDRRIVTIQLQVLLAERIETTSYSYRALRQFSLTQGAQGESRTEIRIWIGPSEQHPLHFRANPGTDFSGLQRLLAARLG
jgi:hypothetical protein